MFSNSSAIRISLPTLIAAFGVLAASALAAPPKQKPSPTPSRQKQAPAVEQLDLAQAEAIAVRQSPTINAAQFKALAAHQVYRQVRSAFFPQITAESSNVATGDDIASRLGLNTFTHQDTRIAASGGLNNPTVLSRQANGILFSQLLTDFGRTWNLTAASKNHALSQAQRALLTRARVLL